VRVTNINKVDLNTYRFDHDLTMAIVLANSDGTVYHRYGGRADLSPMSMEGLVGIMKDGVVTHREYQKHPSPPEALPPLYLPELASDQLQGRIAPMFGCFHCHYAREARQYLTLEAGEWTPDQYWIFPEPKRIGIVMDQRQQSMVRSVLPDSPAAAAGITVGDQLVKLDGKRVLTKYDIQWILDQREDKAGAMSFAVLRDGRPVDGKLVLEDGWKVGDPADYSWRVRNVYTEHMIKFLPAPGFVGDQLTEAGLKSLGLANGTFALKISELNQGTHLAGVRRGDVVVSAGGRSDFDSPREFYECCELLRRSGRDLQLRLIRQGSELGLMVSQSHLNYSKVEKAPRAALGFIVQQLPGSDGLRVGHVSDACSAERAGVMIGDRIVALDGQPVTHSPELFAVLDNKSPGEMLTIDLTRDGNPLQIGFVLAGEEERKSKVARLSGAVTHVGQKLTCHVSIKLPEDKHIYSMHRGGVGVPTQLEFRGRGYKLLGPTVEPEPRMLAEGGLDPAWILDGEVELKQTIEVLDPASFQLLLQVYAQVCDESRCHEFRAMIGNDGSGETFSEFRGRFENQPEVSLDR
jgi:membrane-associated protease RseP (regulator of RpoE activity)